MAANDGVGGKFWGIASCSCTREAHLQQLQSTGTPGPKLHTALSTFVPLAKRHGRCETGRERQRGSRQSARFEGSNRGNRQADGRRVSEVPFQTRYTWWRSTRRYDRKRRPRWKPATLHQTHHRWSHLFASWNKESYRGTVLVIARRASASTTREGEYGHCARRPRNCRPPMGSITTSQRGTKPSIRAGKRPAGTMG